MRRTPIISAAFALATIAAVAGVATPVSASTKASVLYNSTISPLPGNLPSLGFQAVQTSEFGNQIKLTKAGQLGTVVVTMSSFACQTGSWNDDDCMTTSGATFSEPITLNLYHANAPGSTLPGSLILSKTKTFAIPYRPSASAKCTGAAAGDWFDGSQGCFDAKAVNITFSLDHSIPQSIVYGIVYNTSQYGPSPYGALPCELTEAGCPYNSLNVSLSTKVSTGTNPDTGKLFWNTSTASDYCDGGTAGSGFFRLDSPDAAACWGVNPPYTSAPWYFPAVQFNG